MGQFQRFQISLKYAHDDIALFKMQVMLVFNAKIHKSWFQI